MTRSPAARRSDTSSQVEMPAHLIPAETFSSIQFRLRFRQGFAHLGHFVRGKPGRQHFRDSQLDFHPIRRRHGSDAVEHLFCGHRGHCHAVRLSSIAQSHEEFLTADATDGHGYGGATSRSSNLPARFPDPFDPRSKISSFEGAIFSRFRLRF